MRPLPLHTPQLSPDARTYLQALYLDWFSNYLTAEKFAEHNGINVDQANTLIAMGMNLYTTPHPDA